MTRAAARGPRPSELGLLGEVDGLDDRPGVPISRFRTPDAVEGPRALATGYGILALVLAVTAGLYTSIFYRGAVDIGRRPAAPPHPFEVPGDAAPNIIMEVRGDPIMIVRREGARPRPVPLALPAALSDGPAAVDTALRVTDTLVSEDGGFMGSLPGDDEPGALTFLTEDTAGPSLTAEDIVAVMSSGAAAAGEMTVAEYTLLEADIPAEPGERVAEAGIAALVRATAVARGWITAPRRSGRGAEATAAIIRELGRNTSRLEVSAGGDGATLGEVRLAGLGDEPVAALLARNGFDAETAAAVETALRRFHEVATVAVGDSLFVRYRELPGGRREPVQVSLGGPAGFVGAVALGADGGLVAAEEPRGSRVEDAEAFAMPVPAGGYTLRDGLYSAGVRNAIPEPIVREAISVLGRTTDLSAAARPGDAVEFLYTETPRDIAAGTGRVLYVGLRTADRTRPCYVFRTDPGGPFGCLDASGTAASSEGMIAPVKGRLTSRFGMRVHPILKYARLHKGIDFGAPIGTPVVAVAPGTVAFAGVARGYGNYVKIAHDARTVTAYAHLDQFEAGLSAGQKVAQGQRIGYLGTTGLSTGPHLHFELYVANEPVDPLTHDFRVADAGAPDPARLAAFTDRKAVVDRVLLHVLP